MQLVRPDEAERGAQIVRNAVEKYLWQRLQHRTGGKPEPDRPGVRRERPAPAEHRIYGSRIRIQGRNLPEDYTVLINGEELAGRPRAQVRRRVPRAGRPAPLRPRTRRSRQAGDPPRARRRRQRTLLVRGGDRRRHRVQNKFRVRFDRADRGRRHLRQGFPQRRPPRVLPQGQGQGQIPRHRAGRYPGTRSRPAVRRIPGDADPQDVFRRLDRTCYYPVYGDDSTTYRDVDTQGRFYLRVDWDKNQALWGNFATGFTGTEYGQYVRSLYGAAFNWRSRARHRLRRTVERSARVRFGSADRARPQRIHRHRRQPVLPQAHRRAARFRPGGAGSPRRHHRPRESTASPWRAAPITTSTNSRAACC